MTSSATPDRCVLQHRGFVALGQFTFRRSPADNMPVVVVPLGGRDAAVPLRALQRELAIPDDSEDGRMLALISESLDYIAGLQPGDPLPREVLTGEASWDPCASHRQRAVFRLRMQLVAWLAGETDNAALSAQALLPERIEQDPRLRAHLTEAFARAARSLDLVDSSAVVVLLEQVAEELAYIEALRDLLLWRVQHLTGRLDGLTAGGWRGDATRLDALTQVHRLAGIALRQIASRFAEVDAHTGEVIATLRNAEGQRIFIRSHRDWLHRSRLAWEPILHAWDDAPRRLDEAAWLLIGRTYQFLAPRFMPVQEWQVFNAVCSARRPDKLERVLQW